MILSFLPLCPYRISIDYVFLFSVQALESSSTWILAFRDEDEKTSWLKGLILATYQASV